MTKFFTLCYVNRRDITGILMKVGLNTLCYDTLLSEMKLKCTGPGVYFFIMLTYKI